MFLAQPAARRAAGAMAFRAVAGLRAVRAARSAHWVDAVSELHQVDKLPPRRLPPPPRLATRPSASSGLGHAPNLVHRRVGTRGSGRVDMNYPARSRSAQP